MTAPESTVRTEMSHDFVIYIAGEPQKARLMCQEYCDEVGMCVSVSDVDYVYTGGRERGVAVRFINYPRFPSTPEELKQHAYALGMKLLEALGQQSFSVVGPSVTTWVSFRDQD